ncbi:Cuticle protein 6 [Portunus trituberculatus]|uniref:Cuticle protein 6 n=1 Tax=Portunus trituberculatus TaxID=210409 RepID=A0A5B7FC71_PORTR|nr:Cuticle protein 6 [Portunus trituberculatus]
MDAFCLFSFQRIVCLLLLVASGRTDTPHSQDHAAADTIYRETVALDGSAGHGTPVVAHGGSLGHGARHGGSVTKDASVVSHGTPVVSHGVPAVSHGTPVVNHGVPVVSHGTPFVSHGVPVVAHSGSVNFGAPIVAHGVSTGYDATVVAHGTPVVAHGGSVGHIVPVVSHGGSVGHIVPVVGHGGLASHTGFGGPITSHGVSVGHGSPVVSHSGAVGHAPEVHAPVVKGAVISHGSGYQEPVRSQYHAQDAYGRYSFGYNAGTSARDETRDAYGNVHGSYTYVDSYGNLQTQHYIAGKDGFQVEGTNLPVQVSHEQRYKRSYAVFPASTEPLVSGVPSGHVTTVTRHQQGPVVADLPGPYGGPRGYGNKVVYQPPVVPNEGLIHANAYGVSPLLGKANLHGNFDKLSYNGFSYGFETGPSSLATYGTHFNQHIPQYSH